MSRLTRRSDSGCVVMSSISIDRSYRGAQEVGQHEGREEAVRSIKNLADKRIGKVKAYELRKSRAPMVTRTMSATSTYATTIICAKLRGSRVRISAATHRLFVVLLREALCIPFHRKAIGKGPGRRTLIALESCAGKPPC